MSINAIPSGVQIKSLAELGSAVKRRDSTLDAVLKQNEPPPVGSVNADNDPSKLYATIQKNGKLIGTFYTSGLSVTPNDMSLPKDYSIQGSGISLADTRIQQLLELYGGEVNYTRPRQDPNITINAATLFAAQLAGQ
ncbi:hypothetical protein [Methylobacterium sp. Leaf113]|uniref:hypothetical protein n=1 Tax=Methylobacterium sp. Leaf113 TaxID=1736259 RepID=UPI000A9D028D|nr:hypothetical protein [Methylobacterium sp. Leaf113]